MGKNCSFPKFSTENRFSWIVPSSALPTFRPSVRCWLSGLQAHQLAIHPIRSCLFNYPRIHSAIPSLTPYVPSPLMSRWNTYYNRRYIGSWSSFRSVGPVVKMVGITVAWPGSNEPVVGVHNKKMIVYFRKMVSLRGNIHKNSLTRQKFTHKEIRQYY